MPDIGRRCLGAWPGRGIVAVWLAVLLAIAPFADRGLAPGAGGTLSIGSAPSDVDALAAQPREPVTAPRASQATLIGVLSRLLPGESKFGPSPSKTPALSAGEHQAALALDTTPASLALPPSLPHQSAVGSAHPPTGPPA